jgi:hypothetical protein
VIFSLSEKLWTEKYPSSRFNHLSTTSASISPSNNGISKFTCTLKGVAWPLDEDASPVGNLSKDLCEVVHHFVPLFMRDSSRNILIGSPTPSYFFSSPMGCFGLGATDLVMDRLVRVPTSCTQILSGTCTKKNK